MLKSIEHKFVCVTLNDLKNQLIKSPPVPRPPVLQTNKCFMSYFTRTKIGVLYMR